MVLKTLPSIFIKHGLHKQIFPDRVIQYRLYIINRYAGLCRFRLHDIKNGRLDINLLDRSGLASKDLFIKIPEDLCLEAIRNLLNADSQKRSWVQGKSDFDWLRKDPEFERLLAN